MPAMEASVPIRPYQDVRAFSLLNNNCKNELFGKVRMAGFTSGDFVVVWRSFVCVRVCVFFSPTLAICFSSSVFSLPRSLHGAGTDGMAANVQIPPSRVPRYLPRYLS